MMRRGKIALTTVVFLLLSQAAFFPVLAQAQEQGETPLNAAEQYYQQVLALSSVSVRDGSGDFRVTVTLSSPQLEIAAGYPSWVESGLSPAEMRAQAQRLVRQLTQAPIIYFKVEFIGTEDSRASLALPAKEAFTLRNGRGQALQPWTDMVHGARQVDRANKSNFVMLFFRPERAGLSDFFTEASSLELAVTVADVDLPQNTFRFTLPLELPEPPAPLRPLFEGLSLPSYVGGAAAAGENPPPKGQPHDMSGDMPGMEHDLSMAHPTPWWLLALVTLAAIALLALRVLG